MLACSAIGWYITPPLPAISPTVLCITSRPPGMFLIWLNCYIFMFLMGASCFWLLKNETPVRFGPWLLRWVLLVADIVWPNPNFVLLRSRGAKLLLLTLVVSPNGSFNSVRFRRLVSLKNGGDLTKPRLFISIRYKVGTPLPAVLEYKSLSITFYHRFLFSANSIAFMPVFVR